MYEAVTYEVILDAMLDRVPDTVDKREGSIIYDALAPAAIELAQMYVELDVVLEETFADTASLDFLIRRCAERGIEQKMATYAVLKGVFNIDVAIGERFNKDDLNYIVAEQISTGVYKMACETPGEVGNGQFGTLVPINYIDGLTSAELTELLIPGEDDEDEEALRARYYATLNAVAFGGNQADYKEKVNAIDGVGGIKIYPAWNGGGTVKLVILNSAYQKPSSILVDTVQEEIDPLGLAGEGMGIAPIGHTVTVEGVTETVINIATTITFQSGYVLADILSYIEAMIDEYFIELSTTWEASTSLVVRLSQIEGRLIDINGILDIANTTLNGLEANVLLDANSIPKRGSFSG